MNTRAHLRTIALPQILHHQLRIVAVTQDRKINDITEEAIRQWLMRNASQVRSSGAAPPVDVSDLADGSLGLVGTGVASSGTLQSVGSVVERLRPLMQPGAAEPELPDFGGEPL